mgnify:CR=1 FL=1
MYKRLVIFDDSKMVDVDLRKLIFCFLIRMSDGVSLTFVPIQSLSSKDLPL